MTGAPNRETTPLKRGGLYISRAIYDRYFAGLQTVILLRRENDLLILPVRHPAGGGYLLKLRNGAGDRVVNAPDFFREHGVDDDVERELGVVCAPEVAGLLAAGAFNLTI